MTVRTRTVFKCDMCGDQEYITQLPQGWWLLLIQSRGIDKSQQTHQDMHVCQVCKTKLMDYIDKVKRESPVK